MSLILDDLSHEQAVEVYLKDISKQMRLMVGILEDAFHSDIELEDVTQLEDEENGN